MATRHCLILWWCFSEEGDGNLLPLPSSLVVLGLIWSFFGVYRGRAL
jgi:hypothetical protein